MNYFSCISDMNRHRLRMRLDFVQNDGILNNEIRTAIIKQVELIEAEKKVNRLSNFCDNNK